MMWASNFFFVTFTISVFLVIVTPFPSSDIGIRSREAFIDCNNVALMRRMEKAGIRFSCLSESSNKLLEAFSADPSANSIYETERVKLEEPRLEDDTVAVLNCPEGFTYVPEKSECILTEILSVDFEGLQKDQVSDAGKKCPEGLTYNEKNGKCYPDSRIFPLNFNKDMIPTDADEEIITRMKCERGTVYVPEVDLCLPITPKASPKPPKLESVEIAFVPHPTKGCPKGSVYSPEIDHCLKIQMPPVITDSTDKVSTPVTYTYPSVGAEKLSTLSENTQRPVRDTASHEEKETEKEPEKRSASDPTQIALQPLTSEAVGWDMCKPGEVYVSEIDLCLKP